MVINKKIKRTMLENKSQYFGSLVLIIISCMLYTMFNQFSSNMEIMLSSFEKNYVQEDANFVVDKKLTNLNAIESKFNLKIEEGKSIDYNVSKDKTLRLFSENSKVDIPAIIEGNKLTDNGILIDPAYAKANSLKIGDNIVVYDKNFKIDGFMSLPNYIYEIKAESDLMNDPNSFGIAVISKKAFDELGKGSIFYAIKFNDTSNLENKITQFKDYLKNQNEIILKWTNVSENPRVIYVSAKIDSIKQMASSLPIAILILTCILSAIVMLRMLKKEAVSIGTLYALGYRKREILKHYIRYPLYIACTGGIIGTLIGIPTIKPMIEFMVDYFNMPFKAVNIEIKGLLISVLLPVVFLTVFGYFVVNKVLKASPVDLMKGGSDKAKVGFIEKALNLDRFKFSTKFKIREQLRSIPRSAFLLLGVIMATMLLLLGFAEKNSIDFLMKDTYENAYKYEYQYVFNSLQKGTPSEGEAFSVAPFTLKTDNKVSFSVYGINPASKLISLKNNSGQQLSTDKVIITKPLADSLKVKAGDTVEVQNKLDSKVYRIKVEEIADTYVGEYIYMPLEQFNSMLKYPSNSYIGLWSKERLNIPEDKLLTTATIGDLKKAFDQMTQPLQYTIGSISVMSFIIGLIVIYVVTSLIIEENKGNISLMKVLGYRKKEVYSLILNSSTFIIILGYIVGVPLLLVSLSALFASATKSMNLAFPVKLDYVYIIVGFIVIYLTYEVSKALSKKKVNKISMTEALKAGVE